MSTECYRIAVVDDRIQLRQKLKEFLEGGTDLQVISEAGDGIEALSFLHTLSAEQKLKPHLIILDVSMPRLGGVGAAQQIKRAYPSVKILFLSNHDYREYFDYAIAGGADGYLLKSDMGAELLAAIRTIRGRDVLISAAVAEPEP